MANASFQIHSISLYSRGGCFWGHVVLSQHVSMPRPMRRLAQAFGPGDPILLFRQFASRRRRFASRANHCAGRGRGGWGGLGGKSGLWVGGLLWFALLASLLCLPAWFAALCLLSVVSALAGVIHLLVNLFLLVGLGLFILSRNTVSNPFAIYNIDCCMFECLIIYYWIYYNLLFK